MDIKECLKSSINFIIRSPIVFSTSFSTKFLGLSTLSPSMTVKSSTNDGKALKGTVGIWLR